jgi:hypothetical protein
MFGELNPENASAEVFFEYAPEGLLAACPGVRVAACPGVLSTAARRSSAYGAIGATVEATGLQPGSVYRYRLRAVSKNTENTEELERAGAEGEFTTGPAPVPTASTGGSTAVTGTSAVVSGVVDPDGLPASYAFELGVYNGANTQYGVVFSGPAGSSVGAVSQTLALTGLQPGTTYAYRIAVSSGYIDNETHTIHGAPETFRTEGAPSLLTSPPALAQLATPPVAFPAAVTTTKSKTAAKKAKKKGKAVKQPKKKLKKSRGHAKTGR